MYQLVGCQCDYVHIGAVLISAIVCLGLTAAAQNLANDIKAEHELLARKNREKDLAIRQYKVVEQQLKEATDSLPNLK